MKINNVKKVYIPIFFIGATISVFVVDYFIHTGRNFIHELIYSIGSIIPIFIIILFAYISDFTKKSILLSILYSFILVALETFLFFGLYDGFEPVGISLLISTGVGFLGALMTGILIYFRYHRKLKEKVLL